MLTSIVIINAFTVINDTEDHYIVNMVEVGAKIQDIMNIIVLKEKFHDTPLPCLEIWYFSTPTLKYFVAILVKPHLYF